jgi:hypothetical protein
MILQDLKKQNLLCQGSIYFHFLRNQTAEYNG